MRIKIIILIASLLMSSWALANVFAMPPLGDDIVGNVYTIKVARGDSIDTIRSRYEISYYELTEANPQVNFHHLKAGQNVIIPAAYVLPRYHEGIVINTAELRLYYFTPDGRYVYTFPVGLGRANWRTPTTVTKIVNKTEDPIWVVPDSIREYALETKGEILPDQVMPGPENPLGKYALYLAKQGYLIHGTNQPESVGKYVSSGCMRLQKDAIEFLFNSVEIGTPVHIIHHANKAGWLNGVLYLESHTPIELEEETSDLNLATADDVISEATQNHAATIDWNLVHQDLTKQNGIPSPIGKIEY